MQIHSNTPLSQFSTMKLGGAAKHLITVADKDQLVQAVSWAQSQEMPIFIMGGGSNVIVRDQGFDGLVIVNQIMGFDEVDETEGHITLQIGAGENWDSTVERSVKRGLTGIEAMSMIPGTTGATPVQNVGAYGQEISDTLIELEAYDLLTLGFVRLTHDECNFSYRNSIFKATENRRYVITSITLRLKKGHLSPPFYPSLQKYFEENDIDPAHAQPADVRQAVIAIRTQKLPDPTVIPNTGSFFKNPIITRQEYYKLVVDHGEMQHFDIGDTHVKLAAGWLIEQAGLKNYSNHGFKTYEYNALVVANEGADSYEDLEKFKLEIIKGVEDKFGVTLEQEPELL